MATLDDLRKLGYTVGLAHGSVQVEQDALDAARSDAAPGVILERASQVTSETIAAMQQDGKLPDDPDALQQMATDIAKSAIEMLTTHSDERVAFHQRSLANAIASPDVWHLEQRIGDAVAVGMYVSTKDDGTGWDEDSQALLDALADPDQYAERAYLASHEEEMAAMRKLRSFGFDVARPALGADTFTVDGKTMTGTKLVAFAETAVAKPSVNELMLAGLANDPALSAETTALIRAALDATT